VEHLVVDADDTAVSLDPQFRKNSGNRKGAAELFFDLIKDRILAKTVDNSHFMKNIR
jgi:hypothetical protein